MTAAATGINEKTAKSLGVSYDKVILSPMSHAGYYPGGEMMTMKVIFEKETYRILGAQIVGFRGVDKRIDVLSTAIRAGMKAYALTELAAQFRGVAAIEKTHEERYRALLKNVETKAVFEKSGVTVWECRNCGHIVVGTKAPDTCPVCKHPQAYFEVHKENY